MKKTIQEILPNATITGWISQNKIQDFLKDVKCLVFPSLWYETFGLTVIEAGAYGIPAIVSQESAASELILTNNTGSIFSTLAVNDLANKINKFEQLSYDELKKLSLHNYNTYNNAVFSSKTYIKDLYRIYTEVIENE